MTAMEGEAAAEAALRAASAGLSWLGWSWERSYAPAPLAPPWEPTELRCRFIPTSWRGDMKSNFRRILPCRLGLERAGRAQSPRFFPKKFSPQLRPYLRRNKHCLAPHLCNLTSNLCPSLSPRLQVRSKSSRGQCEFGKPS